MRVCSSYVQGSFACQGPRMMRGPARPFEHMAPAFAGMACHNIRALERGRAWRHTALQRAQSTDGERSPGRLRRACGQPAGALLLCALSARA